MNKQDHILSEIKKLAHKLISNFPIDVYLYGSRARGQAHRDSDWDLLILTDDSLVDNCAFEKFAYPFTEIGWRMGTQITPLLYSRSEWNAERDTAFYLNVQNEAILL